MHHAERQVQFLLQCGELDMARPRAPDGADHHAALFAFVDELLEGPDRRILLHAELPADHAPAVDRGEVDRLVAGAPDHLVDGGARRGLRHHHVAVWPGGEELGARHASACAEHIFERGLDPLLLEIGLDDARGGVDRSARRLIDDPVDVADRELLLRRGWAAEDPTAPAAATPSAALPALSQEVATIDPQMPAHPRAPVRSRPPAQCAVGSHMPEALLQRTFDTRSVPAQRPATQDRWCGSECARRRARGRLRRPPPAHGFRRRAARARTARTRPCA